MPSAVAVVDHGAPEAAHVGALGGAVAGLPSRAFLAIPMQDAAKFPIVGSAVLFSLFLAFKYLPKNLVNAVLAGARGRLEGGGGGPKGGGEGGAGAA